MDKFVSEAAPVRASSYVIYADLPSTPDRVLLVHGYTGAYDLVSRGLGAYVRRLESSPVPKPLYGEWMPAELDTDEPSSPSDEAIAHLVKRGYLTRRSVDEEQAFFVRAVELVQQAATATRPGYVIMPTYDCNLRCGYCFQDHMRTNPDFNHLLRTMSRRQIDRMVSAFPQIEMRHGVEGERALPRTITLFGGEPLLRQSLPSVKYLIERVKAEGDAIFSAISNATELHHYDELLGPGRISMIQVTIDGPPEQHDTRRIYADGSGSFERIAQNVSFALERDVAISLRMNVDRSNMKNIPRLASEFVVRGWSSNPKFSAYVAPVQDYNAEMNGPGVARKDTFNSWELSEALDELRARHPDMESVLRVDDAMKARAMRIFDTRAHSMPAMSSFCGAHRGMYIFDAFGDIYACWDRTGDKNLRIGWIDDGGEVRLIADMHGKWRNRTVASNPTCRRCRFALHCGGGCAVLAEESSGTIYSNFCDAFGKRFRAKVAEAYEEFASGAPRANAREEAALLAESFR